MSKLIPIAVVLLLIISEVGFGKNTRRKSRRRYVSVLATTWTPEKDSLLYKSTRELLGVDTVEVGQIGKAKSPTAKPFETEVIRSFTIRGTDAERFAYVWRNLSAGVGYGCFSPAYHVKFIANGVPLLQSTICFHCHNLTLPDGIYPFDADGPTGQKLLKAIQGALEKTK